MCVVLQVFVSEVWVATIPAKDVSEIVEFRNALIEAGFKVKLAFDETKMKAA